MTATCLSTDFQSSPSSSASWRRSFGTVRASSSRILVLAPFILTNRVKTSESKPRSVHLDLILPLHIHIPPTANQLAGASSIECCSKNLATVTESGALDNEVTDEPKP